MNQRIQSIADAATLLFLQQGYSKTQISHIAKAVGVSVGTIYLNFSGKQEIKDFILKSIIDPDFCNQEFERPITSVLFGSLEQEIAVFFEETARHFACHLGAPPEDYTFETLISDTFDLLAQNAVGCLFIEKNAFDFEFLTRQYTGYRKHFHNTMVQYMEGFIKNGVVRPLEHVALSTTLIIEILTWWAMDMRFTSFETHDIPIELAKKTCMDNIITAYGL